MKIPLVVVGALLATGGAATWLGEPEHKVSFLAAGELWSDLLRDADQFGLQLTRVSDAEEMDLGRKLAAAYVQSAVTVPAWETYVNTVGQSLAKHVRRPGIQYEFRVIDNPSINAFALPGGRIFVFTGLLNAIQSEAELTAVLGHEIAHVDARHAIERYQYRMKMDQMGLGGVAGMADLVHLLVGIGYAQYQELEADALGLQLSTQAGYNPWGADRMLRTLLQAQVPRAQQNAGTPLEEVLVVMGSGLVDYFRSHPPTEERLRRVAILVSRYKARHAGQAVYEGRENYQRRVPRTQQEFPAEKVAL